MNNNRNKPSHKVNIVILSALIFLAVLCVLFLIYCFVPCSNKDSNALKSTNTVSMNISEKMLFADGPGREDALILYPGAKVDYLAYANLAGKIAEMGVDCFVVKFPLNYAFFDINAADRIVREYNYMNVYVGGHSLGAYAAYRYAQNHKSSLSGLVLLGAADGIDLSEDDFRSLAVFGTCDGIVGIKKIEEMQNMSNTGSKLVFIEGGNHSQYGTYGKQFRDREAEISGEVQRQLTSDAIIEFISSKKTYASIGGE